MTQQAFRREGCDRYIDGTPERIFQKDPSQDSFVKLSLAVKRILLHAVLLENDANKTNTWLIMKNVFIDKLHVCLEWAVVE